MQEAGAGLLVKLDRQRAGRAATAEATEQQWFSQPLFKDLGLNQAEDDLAQADDDSVEEDESDEAEHDAPAPAKRHQPHTIGEQLCMLWRPAYHLKFLLFAPQSTDSLLEPHVSDPMPLTQDSCIQLLADPPMRLPAWLVQICTTAVVIVCTLVLQH